MASDGLSNRQIGDRLFLSPRTVSSHLYRSYPKLVSRARPGPICPRAPRSVAPRSGRLVRGRRRQLDDVGDLAGAREFLDAV